jgi:hypothetical protein
VGVFITLWLLSSSASTNIANTKRKRDVIPSGVYRFMRGMAGFLFYDGFILSFFLYTIKTGIASLK